MVNTLIDNLLHFQKPMLYFFYKTAFFSKTVVPLQLAKLNNISKNHYDRKDYLIREH